MIQKYAKLFSVTVPLAWGMSYLFMALGASEIPAIELVALRCGLAFLALILIFYRHLKETFSWKMMAYSALAGIFTPMSAFAFLVFTVLYMPCIAAFAATKRELGSWLQALLTAGFQTGMAYLVAMLIYQIGNLFL